MGKSGPARAVSCAVCRMRFFALLTAIVATVGVAAPSARAAKLGKQFRVSRSGPYTSIAALKNGGFVVAFGNASARLYNQDGSPAGREFKVNTTPSVSSEAPSVAALSNGGFVVAYASNDNTSGDVFAQRYNQNGLRVGKELHVNITKIGRNFPSVAPLGTGFVVVWEAYTQNSDDFDIYMQRYNEDGKRLGREVKVNAYTTNYQTIPRVAALTNGGFVVVWMSSGQDGSSFGVYGRRFDSTGRRVGPEFLVNTHTNDSQGYAAVRGLNNGGFVVAWASSGQDGDGYGIYAQRFNSAGARVKSEFHVATATANPQLWPSVAPLMNGGFVIAWESFLQDGDGYGAYAQCYRANGTPLGREFRLNTTTAGDQRRPTVATLTDGSYVAAWSSGSGEGVFGQHFSAP